jgi:hypothetical protein
MHWDGLQTLLLAMAMALSHQDAQAALLVEWNDVVLQ